MDGSASRWQSLLSELQKELEQMNDHLRCLERENLRMRQVAELRCPDFSELPELPLAAALASGSLQSAGFRENSKADRSWSLALGSLGAKKDDLNKSTESTAMKNVSFDVEEVEEVAKTVADAESTVDAEKAAKEAGPTRSILKKKSRSNYRVSIEPCARTESGSINPSFHAQQGQRRSNSWFSFTRKDRAAKNPLLDEDQTVFAILRGEKTRVFMTQKPWYVINPDSTRAAAAWQCLTTVALVWVALVTPLQVGLVKSQVDWIFIVSVLVDAIFFVDMLLQFCTTYVRRTPRGDEWEVRMKRIIIHYLSTWFLLDAITLIPFELLAVQFGADAIEELTMIKVIRIFRLLKLTRLVRNSRLAHRLEAPISLPYQHLALLRCVFVLMLLCHWLACLWAAALELVPAGTPAWIDEIAAADEAFGVDTKNSPLRIYFAAFYFCSYTMTSVGYGDIGPQNVFERVLLTGIVMISGLSWACVLGEVCAIVHEMNAESQEFRKRMQHLNRMMEDQGLPGELRQRLRTFFLQNRHQAVFTTHQSLLQSMSPQLQAEVCTVVNLPWLRKVPFFNKFLLRIAVLESQGNDASSLHSCISDVAQELEVRAYAQREAFHNVQVLNILAKGLVVLNTRVASNGAVWGEDFVLADVPLIQRTAGFALTYVEVLCLAREKFMNVIERRRRLCPELGHIVRRYCVRIAVYRGILAEARRLKLLQIAEGRTQFELRRVPVQPPPIPGAIPGVVDFED